MTMLMAVLQDSLRLLKSRSLFWLSLVLSVLAAVALFATYSFNDQGVQFFWFETWQNPMLKVGTTGSRAFVAGIFNNVYVQFWLSWGALILAVLSTSSILPDFLGSGAVELSLSKPIGRVRLFAYKVLGAVLFVLLQTLAGVLVAYLVIGLKFDMWLHGMLWAIPLITLQFLYVYSFSALLAVVTRSTLACVIGTLLFWFAIFVVQFSSNRLLEVVESSRSIIRQNTEIVESIKERAASQNRELNASEERRIKGRNDESASEQKTVDSFGTWSQYLTAGELVIPKTNDIKVIVANLAEAPVGGELADILGAGREGGFRPPDMDEDEWDQTRKASDDAERALRDVKTWKSIGTSSASCLVIFGIAAFLFRRRDF
ncbi:MAG TPA: hypothetical protein VHN77_10270 [Phycisphaerales bacterium]|nr:hypothetical protein [Phycisphaerales bacterium]